MSYSDHTPSQEPRRLARLPLPPPPLFLIQPLLRRAIRQTAEQQPQLFDRLGPHRESRYVIDPLDMPFALYLAPDPDALEMRAIHRNQMPEHDARIAGNFMKLLRLIDCENDGDSLFFSRELDITGNVEAVVSLRNALDDMEGSLAESVAAMFGPPGRGALALLRRFDGRNSQQQEGLAQ